MMLGALAMATAPTKSSAAGKLGRLKVRVIASPEQSHPGVCSSAWSIWVNPICS